MSSRSSDPFPAGQPVDKSASPSLSTRIHVATRSLGQAAEWDFTKIWVRGIKIVLSLLLFTILAALTGGVLLTFLDMRLFFHHPVEVVLRQVIVDTLILLAVVEVFKTTLAYFSEGRVKVTFIVDTILVVMLTEIISQWFKGENWTQLALLGGILLTLGTMRVLAVQFSPAHGEAAPEAAKDVPRVPRRSELQIRPELGVQER